MISGFVKWFGNLFFLITQVEKSSQQGNYTYNYTCIMTQKIYALAHIFLKNIFINHKHKHTVKIIGLNVKPLSTQSCKKHCKIVRTFTAPYYTFYSRTRHFSKGSIERINKNRTLAIRHLLYTWYTLSIVRLLYKTRLYMYSCAYFCAM